MMAPKRRVRKPPLEVVSRFDGAWYDGDIAIDGSRLRVHFDGFGPADDEFWDEKFLESPTKVKEIVRLRSKQLQDSHCTTVTPGMIVCANFRSPDGRESKYYDAKVLRVDKHSHITKKTGKIESCTCEFQLTWVAGPQTDKEVQLRCEDISFIDHENVEKHPIVSDIIRNVLFEKTLSLDRENFVLRKDLDSLEEVNCECFDKLSTSSREESVFISKDAHLISKDIFQDIQNYLMFNEFLGDEAQKLIDALQTYKVFNFIK